MTMQNLLRNRLSSALTDAVIPLGILFTIVGLIAHLFFESFYFFTGTFSIADILLIAGSASFLYGIYMKWSTRFFTESGECYKILIGQSLEASFLIQNGIVTFSNGAFSRLFGYETGDTTIGREFILYVSPENRDIISEYIRKHIAGEPITSHISFSGLNKNGTIFPVEMRGYRISFHGRPALVYSARDVTETTRLLEQLRESEERYRTLFLESKDALYVSTVEGYFQEINPAGLALFGYSSEEEIRTVSIPENIYWDPVDRIQFKELVELQGFVKDYETAFRRRDGSKAIVLETSMAIVNKNGAVTGYRGFVRDITEQKRLLEELRDANIRYENFILNSQEGIWRIELSEPADVTMPAWQIAEYIVNKGKFVEANTALARMYGFDTPEEFLNRKVSDVIADRDAHILRTQTLIENGFVVNSIPSIETDRFGAVHHFENSYTAEIVGGKLYGMWGVQRDVTHQEQLMNRLIESQKMESIGNLAGGIAHDFNNIVGAILGYATLLKNSLEHIDVKLAQYASTIERSAERAGELTQQLLAFARGGKYKVSAVDPNKTIQDVVRLLERTIDKSIQIRTSLDSSLPPIEGDETQIHQVLLNICVNARDAMPTGGTLSIESGHVILTQRDITGTYDAKPGSYVFISISDSGLGMVHEIQKKIFEPYFTTKKENGGTGLGLAVVYGIVRNHGGFMTVQSEAGKGSTFRVFLPIGQGSAREAEPITTDVTGGTETILVIDDENDISTLAREVLEPRGYTVLVEGDGVSGLKLFREHSSTIQLVILDMNMPGMGGIDVIPMLRAINPMIRILISSGYSREIYVQSVLTLPRVDFIQKPFQIAALVQSVRTLLDRKE
jgi:two-component system, cell cycle sensor histidine kinase and response regulator CckA